MRTFSLSSWLLKLNGILSVQMGSCAQGTSTRGVMSSYPGGDTNIICCCGASGHDRRGGTLRWLGHCGRGWCTCGHVLIDHRNTSTTTIQKIAVTTTPVPTIKTTSVTTIPEPVIIKTTNLIKIIKQHQ